MGSVIAVTAECRLPGHGRAGSEVDAGDSSVLAVGSSISSIKETLTGVLDDETGFGIRFFSHVKGIITSGYGLSPERIPRILAGLYRFAPIRVYVLFVINSTVLLSLSITNLLCLP